MIERLVIVGAGQAAVSAIAAIRKTHAGPIDLVGEEPYLPYQRPPLSKRFLSGEMEVEHLSLRPESYYAQHGVRLHLGERAMRVDRTRRKVLLGNGESLSYSALLLTLGATPRPLALHGMNLPGICYLRRITDVSVIRDTCKPGQRAVIVGGGYIGLEVAATLAKQGMQVTVLETGGRLMQRVVCEEVSAFFLAEHLRRGVRVVLNARVNAFVGGNRVNGVCCADGETHPADFVLVGVGAVPVTAVAAEAGLACDNGIVVDSSGRTSDPNIYAAGDCANAPRTRCPGLIRLESVDNAIEQANVAVAAMLGNAPPKEHVPWFWTDQYDTKLVIIGLAHGHDRIVIRGDSDRGPFSACYMRGRELIAIETVNSAQDQMAARQLIAARAELDAAKVADRKTVLKDCT